MADDTICAQCEKKLERYELKKCPTCHKLFCEECAMIVGGAQFCSKFCSDFFFFGDGTSEDD